MAILQDIMDRARHRVALGRPAPDPSRRWAPDAAMGPLSVPAPDMVTIPFDVHAPKSVLVVHHTALTENAQADLREQGYWLQGGPYWLVFVRHGHAADTGAAVEQACAVYAGDLQPPILRVLADGGFAVTDAAPYTIWARNTPPPEPSETEPSAEEQETER